MSTPTVLFVHAHPDDESIATGGTLARLVRAGAHVVLLTATRGEGGEVIGEELAHLEGDRAGLAAHRETELAEAMRILGVRDHRFLGAGESRARADALPSRRFEDSGMVWGADGHAHAPESMPDAALCAADLGLVAAYVGEVVDEVDPDIVITYAADGGYGHPDHRRAHDATVAAVRARQEAGATAARLLTIVNPPEAVEARFDSSAPGFDLTGFAPAQTHSTFADEVPVAVVENVEEVLGLKAQAMAAHATQITVAGEFFALSNGVGQRIDSREHFALVDPLRDGAPAVSVASAPLSDVLGLVPDPAEKAEAQRRAHALAAGAAGAGAAGTGTPGSGGPDRAGAAGIGAATAAGAGGVAGAGAPGLGVPIRVREGLGAEATAGGTAGADAHSPAAGVAPEGSGQGTDELRRKRDRREGSWTATLGGAIHGLVIGLVVGTLGSFQHLNAFVWHFGQSGVIVPWGLALALALALVSLWHISVLYRSALVTVLTAAVISGVGFLLGQPSLWPGSDIIVTGSLRSVVWLFAPMVAAAVLVFLAPAKKAPARAQARAGGTGAAPGEAAQGGSAENGTGRRDTGR
ncbi:PIG-L family deacetylase [Brevibacterium album]|uniref:PIG-L family deacetylase n=1 Tax=Brevibacterium album TaxID=417948 RepID=UPI0003FA4B3E|nr:PIG-L family deacetylase [Brevibacterium album]